MRPAHLAFLAALAAAGCSTPCQDLGDRLCQCTPAGTAQDTCKTQVKNQLSAANPSGSVEDFCSQKLGSCKVPASAGGAGFCDWFLTQCGKEACGLAFDTSACLDGAPVTTP
jgi:hypothetical protein